jgi:hypothetical protein
MTNKSGGPSVPQEGLFKGVLLAYLILVLHVVLILGLGVLMLLFGGLVAYLPWIMGFGFLAIAGSCYFWWKHMKKRGRKIRDVLRDPLYQGRSVEVSFLGGVVSLKLGKGSEPLALEHSTREVPRQIVDRETLEAEELTRLAHQLKDDLITIDEYLEAKKEITG